MILDRLEHADFYRPLGERIAAALDYLRQTRFEDLADGRHELDGDRLVAIVQRYRPKPVAEARWEAHRHYIDVQYVAEGCERIGFTLLRHDLPVREPYDPHKDVVFFDATGDLLAVSAGSFAIFTPHDVHAPSLLADSSEATRQVCKVVVKCRIGD